MLAIPTTTDNMMGIPYWYECCGERPCNTPPASEVIGAMADFQMIHELPPELFILAVSMFCDGQSLSTLALALAVSLDPFCEQTTWHTIPIVVQKRLLTIATLIETNGLENDVDNTRGVIGFIESIASSTATICDPGVDTAERMRLLSENMIVLDFLEQSLRLYSIVDKGHFEWPVWCGRLTFDSTVSETRMRHTAAVVMTAPMKYPSFIPGASLVFQNQIPTASFRCEPQNRRPLPPWGRVRAFPQDHRILAPVMDRLEQWNQVAVPALSQSADTLNVAMLTQKQAKTRLAGMRPRKSAWVVESDDKPSLLFCWHDDSTSVMNSRDYVTYMMDLMKAQDHLEALGFLQE